MKILLIFDDFLTSSIKIGATMMRELAEELVKRGHEVTVITPNSDIKAKSSIESFDGIRVCYFYSGSIKNVNWIKRTVNETLLSKRALSAFKQYFTDNPHDYIIYYSPTIFWGVLVSRLKKLWNAPSYLILRDFFPQWVIDSGILKNNSIITKYFRYYEKISYKAADTIAVQSPNNLLWFNESLRINKPVDILYNWAANRDVTKHSNHYRKQYHLEDKIVYFYGGNIGHAQDMMNIVRLAKNMANYTRAHFVLVGEGDEVGTVRNAIKEMKLSNITLLPPIDQSDFNYMLAEFDIGLFTLHKSHTTHNFPGKLLTYMNEEKPILGSVNPGNDVKSVMEKAQAGLITINGNDQAFLSNAKKLLMDDEFRKSTGSNAKKLLHDLFSVESAADKILQSYSDYKQP